MAAVFHRTNFLVDAEAFTAGLRFYLLLPQLLRLSSAPTLTDAPARPDMPDFSYEADSCRHCPTMVTLYAIAT